jgi:hypothetical protein
MGLVASSCCWNVGGWRKFLLLYELVNEDNSLRVLIELVFAAMLLLSIGGIGGRLARNIRLYSFRRDPVFDRTHGAPSVVTPKKVVRKG